MVSCGKVASVPLTPDRVAGRFSSSSKRLGSRSCGKALLLEGAAPAGLVDRVAGAGGLGDRVGGEGVVVVGEEQLGPRTSRTDTRAFI